MLNTISNQTIGTVINQVDSDTLNARKELIDSIDKLISAVQSNKDVQRTADALTDKGWWNSFTSSISGSNDKDLAGMVNKLGGSLETTQAVVQVILRLQTRKDNVLRDFHGALVDKILKIQADTKTLDKNQRGAALEIISALKDQIEDQLRQSDMVDQHELRLQEIDKILISAEEKFREHLKALDYQCASLKKSDDYLSCEVEEFQVGLKALVAKSAADLNEAISQTLSVQAELRFLAVKSTADINAISAAQEELRNDIVFLRQGLTSATGTLSSYINHQSELMTVLEARLTLIESEFSRGSTWPARLLRHSVGLVGILISVAALAVSLRV